MLDFPARKLLPDGMTVRQMVRAFLGPIPPEGPFTAAEVARLVGADPHRVFEELKDLMRSGEAGYAPLDLYPKGTKFPFTSPADRAEKTLFVAASP